MNGFDFHVLWEAGRAVLAGSDPYAVEAFFYPLPVAYLFAPLGALPFPFAFALWLLLNLALVIYFFRRWFWAWLLFAPVLHLFSSGQVEMVLWSLERKIGPQWSGALLAGFITLKPQLAVVLLPWHLYNWVRYYPKMLIYTGLATLTLWATPAIWRPLWIRDWLEAVPASSIRESSENAPGLFSLLRVMPELWPLLTLIALALVWWGIRQSNEVARACMQLASPVGLFYSTFALLGTAPAFVLVPISIVAAGLALLTWTFIPFALLPLTTIVWQRSAISYGLRATRTEALRGNPYTDGTSADRPIPV